MHVRIGERVSKDCGDRGGAAAGGFSLGPRDRVGLRRVSPGQLRRHCPDRRLEEERVLALFGLERDAVGLGHQQGLGASGQVDGALFLKVGQLPVGEQGEEAALPHGASFRRQLPSPAALDDVVGLLVDHPPELAVEMGEFSVADLLIRQQLFDLCLVRRQLGGEQADVAARGLQLFGEEGELVGLLSDSLDLLLV